VHDTGERRILAERVLRLEGSVNLRDIGGYVTRSGQMVRWGQVYRSGTLIDLTSNDWDYLKQLNIQTVCDFRSHDEVLQEPDTLPAGIRYLHQPVVTEDNSNALQKLYTLLFTPHKMGDIMQQMYTKIIIDQNPQLFHTAFTELSNPSDAPLLIHCTAGKDRTGITIALLLEILGVPDDVIIADYTLSNHYYESFAAYAQHTLDKMRWFHVTADVIQPFLLADARIMTQTLRHIRSTYGSVEFYLRTQADITPQMLDAIREKLLEPAQLRG
jgi:protein-tyrosine phosphatase